MAALVIKNMPPELHRRLKTVAKEHHRSMTQEVLVVLEAALVGPMVSPKLPKPVKPAFPVSAELVRRAVEEGRP